MRSKQQRIHCCYFLLSVDGFTCSASIVSLSSSLRSGVKCRICRCYFLLSVDEIICSTSIGSLSSSLKSGVGGTTSNRLSSSMSATTSSFILSRVLARHLRRPASSCFPQYSMRRAVPCYSNRTSLGAAFSTSSTRRNLEQSVLGNATEPSGVLHPTLKPLPLHVVAAEGTMLEFSDGRTVEDTTCGAAVACIGHHNELVDRVKAAISKQWDKFAYSNSMFYGHSIGEELAAELLRGTNNEMSKVYLMCSGTSSSFLIQSKMRTFIMCRSRSHGGSHEDGKTVLYGVEPQTVPAHKFHCTRRIVSRLNARVTVDEWSCRTPETLSGHAVD